MEDPAFQEELHGAVEGGPPRPVNAFEPDFVAALELLKALEVYATRRKPRE
jgi:hypothetical protein